MRALQDFVDGGGTLIAMDGAADPIVRRFALPVRNALDGLAETDFYCPGSLLRVVMNTSHPLGWGLPRETAVLFMRSAAWEVDRPDRRRAADRRRPLPGQRPQPERLDPGRKAPGRQGRPARRPLR